jgi:predicted anti-sigma-YlaC factor YlaD
MCNCNGIQDLLADYLNGGLNKVGNAKVIFHLSACKECREEAAFLIRLKNAQAQALERVPDDIAKNAFDLIGAAEETSQSPIAVASGALELVGSILRLAASAIV